MDLVQCQFMSVIITLLVINIGLVIGVFLKWNAARQYCKGGRYVRRYSKSEILDVPPNESLSNTREYPFIVGITYSEEGDIGAELHCGGVIIGDIWALTAGHCIDMLQELPYENIAVYGGTKLWRIAVKHDVIFMVHHDSYNNQTFNADVGLIKVRQPFQGNFERSIVIADNSYKYQVNTTATAVGWSGGYIRNEYRGHDILSSAKVLILDHQYCDDALKRIGEEITDSIFCAGSYTGEKPACHLDSGGPLLDGELLIGVVSWGRDCGKVDQPAVYTKVSIFEKWLQNVIKANTAIKYT